MEYIIGLVILGSMAFGIAGGITQIVKESAFNAGLRRDLLKQQRDIDKLAEYVTQREDSFKQDYCTGRRWLAEFIAESQMAFDSQLEDYLESKSHPAYKAAEVVSKIKKEKKEATTKLKFLEYQLKAYEEYFPQLEDFRETILEERVPFGANRDNFESLKNLDPAHQHLSREEWDRLDASQRNQLALDRYVSKHKSNWEIGIYYERYLGYLKETAGWRVEFCGAIKGFEDFGRDLICTKGKTVEIVQAKNWSRNKVIHEKHIFQLFATSLLYGIEHPSKSVMAVFATTTALSDTATAVARQLNVKVESTPLPKRWPLIKCNVNPSTKEKIYHLPFDQQYDRVVIGAVVGECYASSVTEAEELGFRRAFRHLQES